MIGLVQGQHGSQSSFFAMIYEQLVLAAPPLVITEQQIGESLDIFWASLKTALGRYSPTAIAVAANPAPIV